jgi:broad specificity phosphatase PhoE
MTKWPQELLIVRHGQSQANVRKDEARAARAAGEGTPPSAWAYEHERDMDTPLTDLGRRQALALGMELGRRYPTTKPLDYIVMSPYVRTRQTTELVIEGMGYSPTVAVEERIREIEFGLMDGLSREGVRLKYPDEAIRRDRDGKYWYRPPGGESRPDVRLRVHSFLDTLNRDYLDTRTLIVCHSVVVLAFRSLLERWDEEQYMKADQEDDCKNCGLATYVRRDGRRLVLHEYNTVIPPTEGTL